MTRAQPVRAAAPTTSVETTSVEITLPAETIGRLSSLGLDLWVFRATRGGASGRPLVWQKVTEFLPRVLVGWGAETTVYTAGARVVPTETVRPTFETPIDPGQTLEVKAPGGTGEVTNTGMRGVVTIDNQLKSSFSTGLSATPRDASAPQPFSVFALSPGFAQIVEPLDQLVLFFADVPLEVGAVVAGSLTNPRVRNRFAGEQLVAQFSVGPGLWVDLTGVPSRSVRFDLDQGWEWGQGVWGRSVAATEDLVPLLIQPFETVPGSESGASTRRS